jgi:hypothetical protein
MHGWIRCIDRACLHLISYLYISRSLSITPQGQQAPYQVQLDDGRVVVVRSDCSSVICSAPHPDDEESAKGRDRSWYTAEVARPLPPRPSVTVGSGRHEVGETHDESGQAQQQEKRHKT